MESILLNLIKSEKITNEAKVEVLMEMVTAYRQKIEQLELEAIAKIIHDKEEV